MQKITINEAQTTNINSTLTLTNRKKLSLTGVSEIISSNDQNIYLKINSSKMVISGRNINITKLDVTNGLLEAEGMFDCMKYDKSGSTSLFKRIFK